MQADRYSPMGVGVAILMIAGLLALISGCETKKQAKAPGGSEQNSVGTASGTSPETSEAGAGEAGGSPKQKFGSVVLTGIVKLLSLIHI